MPVMLFPFACRAVLLCLQDLNAMSMVQRDFVCDVSWFSKNCREVIENGRLCMRGTSGEIPRKFSLKKLALVQVLRI